MVICNSVEQQTNCLACGQQRSHCYSGPVFGPRRVEPEDICPWCIADGRAAAELGVEFASGDGLGAVDAEVMDTVTMRTPGYLSWQQDQWRSHCDDACEYLGRVGVAELAKLRAGASDAIRRALQAWGRSDDEREEMFGWLHRDGNHTGYLFRCLHCGAYEAHVDSS